MSVGVKPLTLCWSKGRDKLYPYYLWNTPGCVSKRISIPRTKIEDGAEAFLDLIVEASSDSVIKAYEARIDKLEREKLILVEKSQNLAKPRRDPSEVIEPALRFLANPWNIFQNANLAVQQTVLNLSFAEPLRYCRNEGYRTANIALPFKVLENFSTQKCEMVVVAVTLEPVSEDFH